MYSTHGPGSVWNTEAPQSISVDGPDHRVMKFANGNLHCCQWHWDWFDLFSFSFIFLHVDEMTYKSTFESEISFFPSAFLNLRSILWPSQHNQCCCWLLLLNLAHYYFLFNENSWSPICPKHPLWTVVHCHESITLFSFPSMKKSDTILNTYLWITYIFNIVI